MHFSFIRVRHHSIDCIKVYVQSPFEATPNNSRNILWRLYDHREHWYETYETCGGELTQQQQQQQQLFPEMKEGGVRKREPGGFSARTGIQFGCDRRRCRIAASQLSSAGKNFFVSTKTFVFFSPIFKSRTKTMMRVAFIWINQALRVLWLLKEWRHSCRSKTTTGSFSAAFFPSS